MVKKLNRRPNVSDTGNWKMNGVETAGDVEIRRLGLA
jgi:hypothetical protein